MSDMQNELNEAQLSLIKRAEENPSSLVDFWKKLTPETQQTLKNSLIGGLVGGVGGAGAGIMSEKRSPVSTGIMGALMGALAGGGGTLGYQLLTGKRKFPGEPDRTPVGVDATVDNIADKLISNPGLAAGTLAGGALATRGLPSGNAIAEAASQGGAGAYNRVQNALRRISHQVERNNPGRLNRVLNIARERIAYRRFASRNNLLRHPLALAALPVGAGVGYMVDRYLRGDNE